MTFEELIKTAVKPLLTSPLMTAPAEGANIVSLTEAFVVLKQVGEMVEERQKALRDVILAKVAEFGKDDEKGGRGLLVEGSTVRRERRMATLPEEKGLKALLTEHALSFEEAFSKVTSVVLDASKVKALVDLGKLPEEKVDALKKITWALRVIPSDQLTDTFERVLVLKEALPDVEPREKRPAADGNRKTKKAKGA